MRNWWLVVMWAMVGELGVMGTAGPNSPGYRLPDSVLPTHYTLDIITHLEPEFYFTGKVWIKVNCTKPTNTITLHSNKLNITENEVTVKEVMKDEESFNLRILHQNAAPENEFYVLTLEKMLKPGKEYIIYLPYRGILTEGLEGYYTSKYFDKESNMTKWMAVTQFQPMDARRAFPCFDEPAMKARFKINLGHKAGLKSISNMRIQETKPMEELNGWVWDHYEETVPMSTYLVAFVVGELESRTSDQTSNNVTFRIWARKDVIDQVEFAREIGPKILEYYEQYFDVRYPLPKLDMVAIPDFIFGAMENWGLITYSERWLLFDEYSSSSTVKQWITSIISHELAHQWLGNLVTMKWWTDLWLNEGFATYMAGIGVHHTFPDWNSLELQSLDNTAAVFELDAFKSSHAVSIKINNVSDIGQIFDRISYMKGAALLRVMNLFLGETTFRKGVSSYLKEHKYSNAEQDDLWHSLNEQAHKDGTLSEKMTVKEIMDTWTVQPGYPLLTVIRDYENGTAKIDQERYLRLYPEKRGDSNETCWWVPLTFTTQQEADFNTTRPKTWLNCAENKSIIINEMPSKDQWVVFNINGKGLYRVQYDEHNWNLISNTLNSDDYKSIGTPNRAHILMDVLDFAWRGDIGYSTAFKILKYLKREKEYAPWKVALVNLDNINRMLKRTSIYGQYKKFMRELLSPAYGQFGNITDVPERFEDVKHHNTIMTWACEYDVGDCLQQVHDIFSKWRRQKDPETNNPIPSDMKGVVYCNAVRYGNDQVWNYMWERYLKSNVDNEKLIILNALGCSKDFWILNRYLDWSIDKNSGIRKQDSRTVYESVVGQELGFYVGKEFVFKRMKDINEYLGRTNSRYGNYLKIFANHIIREDDKNELIKFVNENSELMKYADLIAQQSIETAITNARWSSKYIGNIAKYLTL